MSSSVAPFAGRSTAASDARSEPGKSSCSAILDGLRLRAGDAEPAARQVVGLLRREGDRGDEGDDPHAEHQEAVPAQRPVELEHEGLHRVAGWPDRGAPEAAQASVKWLTPASSSGRAAATAGRDRRRPVAAGLGEHPQRHPVGHREEDVGDLLRLGAEADRAVVLQRAQDRAEALARLAAQLRELDGDLLVAARQREELEDEGDEVGLGLDDLLEAGDEAARGRRPAWSRPRAARRAAPCGRRCRGGRPRRAAAPSCRSSSAAGRARRRPRARRGRTSSPRRRGARRSCASPRRSAAPSRREVAARPCWVVAASTRAILEEVGVV